MEHLKTLTSTPTLEKTGDTISTARLQISARLSKQALGEVFHMSETKMRKNGIFLTTLLLMLICPVGSAIKAVHSDAVIARVNDKEITQSDLDRLIDQYQQRAQLNVVNKEVKLELHRGLIRRQLLLQQPELASIRKERSIVTAVKAYENRLVINHYLMAHVGAHLRVSEEEIKTYYDTHRRDFASPPRVRASHIMLRTESEARTIRERLEKGEDFKELAKQHSIDLPDALRGGTIGTIEKGKQPPQVEKVLFTLNVGEYSDVIQTPFGYHIFTVDEIMEYEIKPFHEVKGTIRKTILKQKEGDAFNQMAAKLEKDAEIEIFEDRLEKPTQ